MGDYRETLYLDAKDKATLKEIDAELIPREERERLNRVAGGLSYTEEEMEERRRRDNNEQGYY